MTEEELQAEWRYRYTERCGLLADGEVLTREQQEIARREADQWLADWRKSQELL